MRLVIVLFLFVICITSVSGQKGMNTWLECRGKAGFLIAHRSSMGHMAQEHAYATELSYIMQPEGEKAWHSNFRDPLYGFTFFAGTVGSKAYLGHYFGLYSFVEFPFIKYKSYSFAGKLGSGIGYGTKIYNSETNILNVAIGTHFNAQICLGLVSRFQIGKSMFSVSADMTHFSNGATKIPNLGINVPYVSLAYSRQLTEKEEEKREELFDLKKKRWEYGVLVIGSMQEVFPGFNTRFPVFGLDIVGRYFFGKKSAMEVSFDVFSKQSIKNYQPDVEKSQLDILQVGMYCGYIIPLDRVHILIGMGAYLRDKYSPADPLYHRLGFRYLFPNGINLNLSLKSHWARADYIEYGIGYTFKK